MDNDAYIAANDEQQSALSTFSQDGGSDTEGEEEDCGDCGGPLACFEHYEVSDDGE